MFAVADLGQGSENTSAACGGGPGGKISTEQHRRRLSIALSGAADCRFGWSTGGGKRGDGRMKMVFFCHAVSSCWNNGNAHFLRGVTRELARLGHDVMVCEPSDGWSRINAQQDGGASAILEAEALVPGVKIHTYVGLADLEEMLHGADIVLVHEWNPPD